MRKDCYNLFAEMEKSKLTLNDICQILSSTEMFSLDPMAESISKERCQSVCKAMAADAKYFALVYNAVEMIASMANYYLGRAVEVEQLFYSFFECGEFADRCCLLKNSAEAKAQAQAQVSFGNILEKLVRFKKFHADLWESLLYESKKDFSMEFWQDFNKTKHIDLTEKNHFLVHSVNNLSSCYYQQFLNRVPVSCSVFDVTDPWYYLIKSRGILLVYDLSECELLGSSERDCTSMFSKENSKTDINRIIADVGMPSLWDFTYSFRIKPFVKKDDLISQVKKHDNNDVGEVIVLGQPCAIIVQRPERICVQPDEVNRFAEFFGLPVYLSADGGLRCINPESI